MRTPLSAFGSGVAVEMGVEPRRERVETLVHVIEMRHPRVEPGRAVTYSR
jgi:hypothetical protein